MMPGTRQAAVRQVEFYLSLSNLATDQFLRAHMSASPSGTSVPLSVIASFPRMRDLVSAMGGADEREAALADMLLDSRDLIVDKGQGGELQVRRRDGALPALEQAGAKRTKIAEIVVNQSASADVRAPEKSVYVGNLAPQVTDLLLFELFAQVGPVERVTIPLAENEGTEAWRETGSKCGDGAPAHRGYAFVQMADGPVNGAEHSVAYAIRVLNDVALFSRRITVRRSLSTRSPGHADHPERPRVRPGDLIYD